jgi:hypothetical protein
MNDRDGTQYELNQITSRQGAFRFHFLLVRGIVMSIQLAQSASRMTQEIIFVSEIVDKDGQLGEAEAGADWSVVSEAN